ncbi:MAG: ABC transporter transmembrane domain-containing protein, partial [Methylophilaceae bacterium]
MSESSRKKQHQPQVHNAKALFLRIFRYAWRHKYVFAITVFSTAVLSLSNTGFLALIKKVTDEGFVNQSTNQITLLPFMLFGLMAIRGLAGFASMYSIRWIARRVVETIRRQAFEKLMQLSVSYFDAQSTGVLVSKLTYDAERLSTVCTRTSMNVLRDVLTLIGLVGYMLYLDWRLTLIFALVAPLMVLYLSKTSPQLRANAKKVQLAVGEMTKVSEEAISGQRIVKIFGAQDYENQRFSHVVVKNRDLELRTARIAGLSSFVIEILAAFALGLVVYYALGRFTVGEFAAFIGALLMLIAPIKHITSANEDFQIGLAAAQSVFDVIDTPAERDDGDAQLTRARGEIEFRNVTLRYEGAKRPALDNLSFSVKPGEKVALVGRSGGGKTSLVNLLPRFYELQQGLILLDGVDIRALALKDLRAQYALVSQDIILFNDTVFNNIAYGALREASEAEVIAAATAAHAWEFIEQLPLGLQNEIGDRGVRLSGGQRQRIAIARAILKNAPILLLDEATSALDS